MRHEQGNGLRVSMARVTPPNSASMKKQCPKPPMQRHSSQRAPREAVEQDGRSRLSGAGQPPDDRIDIVAGKIGRGILGGRADRIVVDLQDFDAARIDLSKGGGAHHGRASRGSRPRRPGRSRYSGKASEQNPAPRESVARPDDEIACSGAHVGQGEFVELAIDHDQVGEALDAFRDSSRSRRSFRSSPR